jgi:hypothetical protein
MQAKIKTDIPAEHVMNLAADSTSLTGDLEKLIRQCRFDATPLLKMRLRHVRPAKNPTKSASFRARRKSEVHLKGM